MAEQDLGGGVFFDPSLAVTKQYYGFLADGTRISGHMESVVRNTLYPPSQQYGSGGAFGPGTAQARATIEALAAKYGMAPITILYLSVVPNPIPGFTAEHWAGMVVLRDGTTTVAATFQNESAVAARAGQMFAPLVPNYTSPQVAQPGHVPTTADPIDIAPVTAPSQVPTATANGPEDPNLNTDVVSTQTAAATDVPSQMRALAGADLQTVDQWNFWYRQITGQALPAPEDLGFTGAERGRLYNLPEWWAKTFAPRPGGPVPPAGNGQTQTTQTATPQAQPGEQPISKALLIGAAVLLILLLK
jgi:hypothetical protein